MFTLAIVVVISAVLLARGIWTGETTWMLLGVLLIGFIPLVLKSR